MTRYVVFSSNQVQSYEFMAPIAAMCWMARTEFKPVCLLTQTREHWDVPTGSVVVDMLERLEVQRHYVGPITEPYRTSVQAQASRQHAAAHKIFQPDDYIMTMDVDALPINGAWFSNVDWSKPCHIRNSTAWQHRWYTTFGFGATVAAWRSFMGYGPTGDIGALLQKNLDLDLTKERDTMSEWFFDEFLWCSRLKVSSLWPDGCQFIARNVSTDRVDRGCWPDVIGDIGGFIDAHVLRPSHKREHWHMVRALLTKLLSANQLEVVDQYHKRYVEAAS